MNKNNNSRNKLLVFIIIILTTCCLIFTYRNKVRIFDYRGEGIQVSLPINWIVSWDRGGRAFVKSLFLPGTSSQTIILIQNLGCLKPERSIIEIFNSTNRLYLIDDNLFQPSKVIPDQYTNEGADVYHFHLKLPVKPNASELDSAYSGIDLITDVFYVIKNGWIIQAVIYSSSQPILDKQALSIIDGLQFKQELCAVNQ